MSIITFLKKKSAQKKMAKKQTHIKEQEPKERIHNFKEVCLGYAKEEAMQEALRCLQCKKPLCIEGCPVNVNIPKFIRSIKENKFDDAIRAIKETNNLPGVCGRVCPQEEQCEKACILGKKNDPVNIGKLERFAADFEGDLSTPKIKKNNKKIAIVGSGPAGLTCAADLALKGYDITIFEALHDFGGVLRYGIPEFRMPNTIVEKEVDYIKKLGVKLIKNIVVGKLYNIEELAGKFDAVFIAAGAGLPYFMDIPGETLNGVYSANEYLVRINLMHANDFPNYATPIKKAGKVVVVGGGNVAMDAARAAKRLGADVSVVYRRTEAEMPARNEEIKHAEEEGIHFMMLTLPVRILGNEKVEGIECIQMRLGEPDESGRRKPEPIEGSEFAIDCNQVIIAIGQGPNPLIAKTSKLEHSHKNNLIVDENMKTSMEGVYAAGDITSGAATVIKAMGDAKKAAKAIDEYIKNGGKDNKEGTTQE